MTDENTPYLLAIPTGQLFTDPTYQRECDVNRANRMAADWNPRPAGVLDVSDRGKDQTPRYAIINDQHRWRAAQRTGANTPLVCNVHTGLTPADEAALFRDIDATTKALTTWDKWYARRTAGDPIVADIEARADAAGWKVTHHPGDKHLQCCAALQWIYQRCHPQTVTDVLELAGAVWPDDPEAFQSPMLKGLALVLYDYAADTDLDLENLARLLAATIPAQLLARAHELKARGFTGSIPKLVTTAIIMAYNKTYRAALELP